MRANESVEEWARTAEFPEPIVWGDVEAGILTREPKKGPRLPMVWKLRVALAWVGIAAFAIVVFGASVFGLVFVVIGTLVEGVSWDWDVPARFAFAVAALVELNSLRGWFEIRRRSTLTMVVSALTLVASVGAWIALVLGEGFGISWLLLFVTVAAVTALSVIVLGLLSKPEGRPKNRKPPRRGPRKLSTWRDYKDARARVLEILQQVGLHVLPFELPHDEKAHEADGHRDEPRRGHADPGHAAQHGPAIRGSNRCDHGFVCPGD